MLIFSALARDAKVSAHCRGVVHSSGADEPGKFRLHRALPNHVILLGFMLTFRDSCQYVCTHAYMNE